MHLHNQRITVTGGTGFFGSHIVRELLARGADPKHLFVPSRKNQSDLLQMSWALAATRHQDLVIHAAGTVGGIGKNQQEPYTLWSENTRMGLNILDACRENRVAKLVVIGTICEYPKHTPVPFQEDYLWKGYPEETNAPYGVAKKNILVGGQALHNQHGLTVVHLLPVNLYGPGDNFDPASSHVIPALIRKIHEAQLAHADHITVWGSGRATREFLYVEDAARAIVAACEQYDDPAPMNIGAGFEISIADLVTTICQIMGFDGEVRYDSSKPDGQPRRCLDTQLAYEKFGWQRKVTMPEGLQKTVAWFRAQYA